MEHLNITSTAQTELEKEKKQIADFLKMLKCRLNYASDLANLDDFSEWDRLYEHDFTLSFMGKSCVISWGATEYNEITTALENILEEM